MAINLEAVVGLAAAGGSMRQGSTATLPPALKRLALPSSLAVPPPLLLGDMADLATRRTEWPLTTDPALAILAQLDRRSETLAARMTKIEARL